VCFPSAFVFRSQYLLFAVAVVVAAAAVVVVVVALFFQITASNSFLMQAIVKYLGCPRSF